MSILKLPVPSSYTADDNVALEEYLSHYDTALNIYSGDYTASWLLSNIHAPLWEIKTRRTIKRKNEWHNTLTIRWDRELSNGTNLCDENNRAFRELLQKSAFIFYESSEFDTSSIGSIVSSVTYLTLLAQRIYLYENDLAPNTRFLKNITQNDLLRLLTDYANGGVYDLLHTSDIFLKNLSHKIGIDLLKNKNHYFLSNNDRNEVIKYFTDNNFYDEQGFLNRKQVSDHLCITWQPSKSKRHTVMLRQFEPLICQKFGEVLVSKSQDTELPSHRCPIISDALLPGQPGQLQGMLDVIGKILRLKPLFPNEIPISDNYDFGILFSHIKKSTRSPGHTPWIPIESSLYIINGALRVLMTWGDDVLKFYHKAIINFTKNNWLIEDTTDIGLKLQLKRNNWVIQNVPDSLKELNIIGFSHDYGRKSIGQELRDKPTLSDLIIVYIGAISTLIGSMKPMRRSELSELPFDCLRFVENDGFWLLQSLSKSGINNILPETAKPIPKIVARGIQRLQRLNLIARKYSKYAKDNKHTNYLFFLIHPSRSRNLFASAYDGDGIKRTMEIFSDFIESPTDKLGRRYYVNIHELRKSFLLAFFWTFKFSSLDACRWIAGHKSSLHIFEYIEANIPGEEISEIEAEYAVQQLRVFNENKSLSEIENIEDLNRDVCQHFNVENIAMVSDNDLTDWLQFAIAEGSYQITPYSISMDDNKKIQIAVNIMENHDA